MIRQQIRLDLLILKDEMDLCGCGRMISIYDSEPMYANAVFEGREVSGNAHIGALKVADLNVRPFPPRF